MNNNSRTIHETELASLVGTIFNGIGDVADTVDSLGRRRRTTDISKAYSLTRATEGLTLVFPTLVDGSLSIDTASMISKAIERKCVSLMQIALSAFSMNANVDNAVDFIRDFHTNINTRKLDLDGFIDLADEIASRTISESVDYRDIAAVNYDCKNNINYTFNDDINETSLNDFIFNRIGGRDIVYEGKNDATHKRRQDAANYQLEKQKLNHTKRQDGADYKLNKERLDHQIENDKAKNDLEREKFNHSKRQDAAEYKLNKDKFEYDKQQGEINNRQREKDYDLKLRTANNQYFQNQILSSDVKKANELVPSMMVVNFMCKGANGELVSQQSVIGIKSKMYAIESEAIVNKIITKHVDSNMLMKLVKVGTREISFFKDFLLAIDDAKIEAMSKSKKGSSAKLFKVIERRALGGKVRKVLGRANDCKPIFSLAISKQSVDYLMDYNNIDVERPEVVIPLMEKLNLMYFIIVDESTETAKFLVDGDTEYETLAFSSLEKETTDGGYRKVVNLISKVAR